MFHSLLLRIQEEFPKHSDHSIQLSILNENNEYVEFYEGLLSKLSKDDINKVVNEAGKFYYLRIIGMSMNYIDDISSNSDKLLRYEICWLSEPQKPFLTVSSSRSIELKWQPVKFSSLSSAVSTRTIDHIHYLVEMAIAPTNVNLNIEFITVANESNIEFVIVNDLNPATNYLVRLGISYNGITKWSEITSVTTQSAKPSPPSKPRLYNNSIGDNSFTAAKTSLLLRWSECIHNGAEIKKYQVQIKQIYSDGSIQPGDKYTRKYKSTEKNQIKPFAVSKYHYHRNEKSAFDSSFDEDDNYDHNSNNYESDGEHHASQWKTVYCNIAHKCYLFVPPKGISEWIVRVRAKNSCGWSEFSEPLVANSRNYPSLFALPIDKSLISEEIKTTTQYIFQASITDDRYKATASARKLSNGSLTSYVSDVSIDSDNESHPKFKLPIIVKQG